MGKTYDALDQGLIDFIKAQKIYFVATAPRADEGHVNLSPKGYDSFAVLDPNTVAYLDLGGSGVETIAHVRENGRITIMFCAFEGAANILRLYGRGEAICMGEPGFEALKELFPGFDRARAVVRVKLERIADSCGWGVPKYEFRNERDQLERWVAARPREEWEAQRYAKNAQSIDGLTGLVKPDTRP